MNILPRPRQQAPAPPEEAPRRVRTLVDRREPEVVVAPVPARRVSVQALAPMLCLAAIAFGLGAWQWRELGAYPPGPDWSSWLAFGRWWFGDGTKGDVSAYPPLVPVVLHLLSLAMGEAAAARLLAAGTIIAMTAATGVVARLLGCSWPSGLAAAALVGLNGMVLEVMSFAGYPQAYATAAYLLLVPAAVTLIHRPGASALAATAALYGGVALMHHMYFAVASVSMVLVVGTWAAGAKPGRAEIRERLPLFASVAGIGASAFAFTALRLWQLGYDAPLGTAGLSFESGLRYGIRDAPAFWVAILVGGGAFVAFDWGRFREPRWQALAILFVAPLLLFAYSPEPRLLPPLIAAACIGAALAADGIRRAHPFGWPAVPALMAIPVLLAPTSASFSEDLRNYYSMANEDLFETASFVDENADDGLVAVRWTRAGWQLGWWFEGLTDERIAVGSDPKWIGFPRERERAFLVSRLFAGDLSGPEVSALARQSGVTLLVAARFEYEFWREWADDPPGSPAVVFENGRYLVFEVPPTAE